MLNPCPERLEIISGEARDLLEDMKITRPTEMIPKVDFTDLGCIHQDS